MSLQRCETPQSVICYVYMHWFGSFLLQAMFLSLQVFAFKGQNMELTVKMLFTCIPYFDLRDYLICVTSNCMR